MIPSSSPKSTRSKPNFDYGFHGSPPPDDTAISSIHAKALEVCYLIYGEAPLSSQILDRFYENSAIYENPAISATSRTTIHDIFKLGRKAHGLDIPRPIATICSLIGVEPPAWTKNPALLLLRAWNDVGTISEHESFDGQKQAIVEHTLNLLFWPGLHVDTNPSAATTFPDPRRPSTGDVYNMVSPTYHPGQPSLVVPGTGYSFPSPFHFKLPIITRLGFNEQGRITQHRDYWDMKDIMSLSPTLSTVQWLGSRALALSLSLTYQLLPKESAERGDDHLDRAFDNDVGLQGLVSGKNGRVRHG